MSSSKKNSIIETLKLVGYCGIIIAVPILFRKYAEKVKNDLFKEYGIANDDTNIKELKKLKKKNEESYKAYFSIQQQIDRIQQNLQSISKIYGMTGNESSKRVIKPSAFQLFPQQKSTQQIFKICITGGPCAGKTSGLTYIREKLAQSGVSVYVVPEAATLIFNGGGKLDMSNFTDDQILQFQESLMNLQIQLEDFFYQLAMLFGNKTLILCDRGLMDGQAYTKPSIWQKILVKNNLTETQIRDERYDAVIHLVTAADGAEKFYGYGNEARYESTDAAKEIDRKLQQSWLGHSKLEILDNYSVKDFQDKLDTLLQKVKRIIGIEAEKKMYNKRYLIDYEPSITLLPSIPNSIKCMEFFIEDNYILYEYNPGFGGQSIRVRRRLQQDTQIYFYSISKIDPNGQSQVSMKKLLNYSEYWLLMQRKDPKRTSVMKNRKIFMVNGTQYQIDTYLNCQDHVFAILKVKLENKDQKCDIPNFIKIVRDVTNEKGYRTKYMSKKDWYIPKIDEEVFKKPSRKMTDHDINITDNIPELAQKLDKIAESFKETLRKQKQHDQKIEEVNQDQAQLQ